MKNICIVAHPDDEIIWFPAQMMDIIIICQTPNHKILNNYEFLKANHYLKDKIIWLDVPSSKCYKNKEDNSNIIYQKLNSFFNDLVEDIIVWTHNINGETGHIDHKALFHTLYFIIKIKSLYNYKYELWCLDHNLKDIYFIEEKLIKMDIDLYTKCKNVYDKINYWTFKPNYIPPEYQNYKRFL